jgi:hypothetical protein
MTGLRTAPLGRHAVFAQAIVSPVTLLEVRRLQLG